PPRGLPAGTGPRRRAPARRPGYAPGCRSRSWLLPNVRGAVTAGVTHLVCARRPRRFVTEVDQEVLVDRHSAVLRIAVNLEHAGSGIGHLRVELVVPAAEQRGRGVETLPVERELDHLPATVDPASVDHRRFAQQSTDPHLAGLFRMR